MSDGNERDRTLALAGVYQAAALARQLARRGYADPDPLHASVRSVLIIDSINTVSVFGGIEGVRLGLLSIGRQTGSAGDLEVAHYVVALCQLARRFYRDSEMIDQVSSELSDIRRDVSADAEHLLSSANFERCADLYKATLSHLKPRVIVQGEQEHLGNAHVVAQIRTSLLAGVRSGVLFAQLGGSRWQILLQRRRYVDNAMRLLSEIDPEAQSQTLH